MNRLLATSAIALALSTGSAFAADLPSAKAPPVYLPPPPSWTGLYAGLNIGGGWTNNSSSGPVNGVLAPYVDPIAGAVFYLPGSTLTGSNAAGFVGGGQIGFNYQLGSSIVLGAEADIQGTSMHSAGANNWVLPYPSPVTPGGVLLPLISNSAGGMGLPWFGTVRGRAGFLITPTLLVYGTGGFAYGGVTALNQTNTRTGWTAGGGLEWLFIPNWSVKAEYLYADLSSGGATGAGGWSYGYHFHPQVNILRVGANYHFNWGSPAPVVAAN